MIQIDRSTICFYDPGFNPSFTKEADIYTKRIKNVLKEWLTNLKIQWNILFCCNSKERALRKRLWSCVKTEALLDKYELRNCFNDKYVPAVFVLEHDLFERTNKLFHIFNGRVPKRPFPSETMGCIHNINYSQWGDRQKTFKNDPSWRNGDLDRRPDIGLWRLSDRGDVKHADFILAIDPATDKLKDQIRKWRTFLNEDAKKLLANGSKLPQDTVKQELDDLSSSWQSFVKSHEVLEEVQAAFEIQDFRKPYYDYERKKYITYPSCLSRRFFGEIGSSYQTESSLKVDATVKLQEYLKQQFPHHFT